MKKKRAVVIAATLVSLFMMGACSSGEERSSEENPIKGPEYDAAMERCALSRLRNAGVESPTTESWAYLDAYTACTYGRSFDDVSAPGRGWGPADPGYWGE
ncbi:hypothetical protein ACFQ8O_26480 [Streptomyces coelicoflavus]|uniref:hypothetical protein n=1 Tax=Streptomyces coelicoflavus TaxID=285562 RepID=UPI00368A5818